MNDPTFVGINPPPVAPLAVDQEARERTEMLMTLMELAADQITILKQKVYTLEKVAVDYLEARIKELLEGKV
jgi:hypothetical protein